MPPAFSTRSQAATSACSAELIAVSSLVVRDCIGIYKTLSGRQVRPVQAVWSVIDYKLTQS